MDKTKTILIIDDEQPILRMIELMLTRMDFFIDKAENGEEAINKIHQNTYDLIITDMMMPGIGGQQILHYVKNKNIVTPVVGMSGTPWLLDDDYDAVLSKPFKMSELMECIDNVLMKN